MAANISILNAGEVDLEAVWPIGLKCSKTSEILPILDFGLDEVVQYLLFVVG